MEDATKVYLKACVANWQGNTADWPYDDDLSSNFEDAVEEDGAEEYFDQLLSEADLEDDDNLIRLLYELADKKKDEDNPLLAVRDGFENEGESFPEDKLEALKRYLAKLGCDADELDEAEKALAKEPEKKDEDDDDDEDELDLEGVLGDETPEETNARKKREQALLEQQGNRGGTGTPEPRPEPARDVGACRKNPRYIELMRLAVVTLRRNERHGRAMILFDIEDLRSRNGIGSPDIPDALPDDVREQLIDDLDRLYSKDRRRRVLDELKDCGIID